MEDEEEKIDIRDEKELAKNQHKIRESYRTLCWTNFLVQDRRDSREICGEQDVWYPCHAAEQVRKMFISLEVRAIMVGSFFSQAAMAVQSPEKYDKACPRCNTGAVGTWEHMAWECKSRPPGPCKPAHVIQRRLAWPMTHDKEYNEAVFRIVKEVVRWT